MNTRDGSGQFRALMRRLRPLADNGLGDSFSEVARRLDIRPRKPSRLLGTTAIWSDVRIGRIAASATVVAMFEKMPRVLVYSERLVMAEHLARSNFAAVFGNTEVHPLSERKGLVVGV